MTNENRLAEIRERLRTFVAQRDWGQFHDPKNLAMAIASEAGELLAELRWVSNTAADEVTRDPVSRERIEHEVADVAITLLLFCDRTGISLLDAVDKKIELNEHRYPVAKARGKYGRPEPQLPDR